jgi:hypothetical protein
LSWSKVGRVKVEGSRRFADACWTDGV